MKNSSSLAIPIFTIFQSSHSKGNCYVQDQSNFIKEDFYKNLAEGDSVLIQRKEHLLEKIFYGI
ncbi:hypothetical protein EIM50_22720 [Pseudoxanthomonas sp. SGD-10]|nr:hypothetical protein EIM50_22720 [Pseudoxanthomonas sp. SGD-10]